MFVHHWMVRRARGILQLQSRLAEDDVKMRHGDRTRPKLISPTVRSRFDSEETIEDDEHPPLRSAEPTR